MANQQLEFTDFLQEPALLNDAQNILQVELIYQLTKALMPSLLDDSKDSIAILQRICEYLYKDRYQKSAELSALIPEALYSSLQEVKMLLKKQNLNMVSWTIEEHKHQFRTWLEEEIEDAVEGENKEDQEKKQA